MELRNKFSIIVLIYLTSLFGNVVLSGWCIAVYFNSAFADFETEMARSRDIEDVRELVRNQASLLDAENPDEKTARAYADIERRLAPALAQLEAVLPRSADLWLTIRAAAEAKNQAADRRLANLKQDHGPMPQSDSDSFVRLDEALGDLSGSINLKRQIQVARAASIQSQVLTILIASAGLGASLCWLGLFSMRRWVIEPLARLRQATRRIAQGDFESRLPIQSLDELGQLASEVNHMCSTIQDMQGRLIEQERLAAAGEVFARLVHNIRNPLAGIRGLAEETLQQTTSNPGTVECQRRIIRTVDRFEKWLRDMQQTVSPMSLNLKPVRVSVPVESVATALAPLLSRYGVLLTLNIDTQMPPVLIDSAHFEQGLAALVTNAIQASKAGQHVRIVAHALPETAGKWQIVVEDEGPGIPPELRDKIFMPSFTTKREGSGLGLAVASKVVKIHGGQLTFESNGEQGTRFMAVFPGLQREST